MLTSTRAHVDSRGFVEADVGGAAAWTGLRRTWEVKEPTERMKESPLRVQFKAAPTTSDLPAGKRLRGPAVLERAEPVWSSDRVAEKRPGPRQVT